MSRKNIRHDGYTTGIDGDLYTGMNDRNDVPIYEGDKIWGEYLAGIVRFGNYRCNHFNFVGFYIQVTDVADVDNGNIWETVKVSEIFNVHFPIMDMEVVKQ